MKNLTNILSYLWLLLLMAVTACSDLENEVDEMQQQLQESDLVELTIHPHVPGMKAGTRSIENDALTSIKVLAFDESKKLIKVVDAINVTSGTTGSFSVKVPSKTRIIHFIGNLPNGVTLPDVGDSEDELKTITTSGDMSYWGYASFNSVTELKAFKGQTLSLYRNKAKISITAADGVTASIAGVANAYQYGVLVPNNNGAFSFNLDTYDYQTLPSNMTKISDQTGGTFTYVFEHPNDSKSNALNVICLVDGKYYKVVLAKKVNDAMVYYDIIRNHQYNIKINQVDTNLGKADFNAAADVNNEPINDVEVVEDKQVALQVTTSPSSTRSYDNTTYTVTVTTTENKLTDISRLSFSGLNADIYQLTGTTGVTDNGNSTYTVTADQAVFTFTLKDGYIGKEVSNSITFAGDGTHVVVTPATANLNLSTFVDMYEMYFDGGNLGGSTEYDKFFYDKNNVNLQTKTLTTQYVDAGANGSSLAHNHVNAAINMQSNSMIKFTIAEERYLTLLVARNGNAPSIDLQKDGQPWTATSDKTQVPATYNFSKDGDITTSGRLIRYTLPAGTYTLQRGNDDKDYLLYYMRVTTTKPVMTDVPLQPTNNDYRFWWTGGDYGNWTYVENVGYVVDDDAKTFNVALTDQYLNNNDITGGELSLKSLQLNVTNSSFNNNSRDYTNTNNNSNVEISEINSGTYTYTIGAGVINNPVYKYTNFYDKIPVNAVNNGSKTITVKNSLKLKLVNGETSYNGKENVVDYYTTEMTDPRLAIVSPAAPLKPQGNNNPFVCTIQENWQFIGANNKTLNNGSSLISQNNHTFTIAQGTETYTHDNGNTEDWQHPFWMTYIYYFDWGNFTDENNTNRTLSDITIGTEDADVWFSYKGMDIAKNLTIKVNENPGEVVEPEGLDIALDFYVGNNADGGSDQYTNNNLVFGETNLYLKVTIPENVAAGTRIELDMETGGENRGWINEWNSRDETRSDGVSYRYNNGITGLELITEAGKRDYLMCWTFVRSDNTVTNPANITYTLRSDLHKLSGETSANLTITGNNKQIQVSAHDRPAAGKINISLPYDTDTTEEFTVDVVAPDGVTEIKIEAEDFDVAWSDGSGKVSKALTYSFPTKENLTHRFKFTLKKDSKSVKTSNIIFSCDDKYVANGTVVVELSQRSSETVPAGGTTIWSGLAQLEWSVNYLSIPNTIAKGSTVRINFAQNSGTFKLHDGNGNAFKLGKEANNYPQNDSYLGISQNYYEFEVNDITSGTNITTGLQGLKINGDNVTVTSVVVYEGSTSNESVVFGYDFEDEEPIGGWGGVTSIVVYDEDKQSYVLKVERGSDGDVGQLGIGGLNFSGNYTVSMKLKTSTSVGTVRLVIQYSDEYRWRQNAGFEISGFKLNSWDNTITWDVTISETADQFVIRLEGVEAGTVFYIDDLKLVKKNN